MYVCKNTLVSIAWSKRPKIWSLFKNLLTGKFGLQHEANLIFSPFGARSVWIEQTDNCPNHQLPLNEVLTADLSNGSLVDFSKATCYTANNQNPSPCSHFQWPRGSIPVLVTYQSDYFSVISNSYFSCGISDSLNLLLICNMWLIKIITTFVDKVNSTFNSFFT